MNSTNNIEIRAVNTHDLPCVRYLWKECGLFPSRSDTDIRLEEVVRNLGDLFLVACAGDGVVGSVMGSFDGRRGWINRLVVHPRARGERIGERLLREVEESLKARGCDKVNLLIEPENK
jgi:ribosomal protein S18 acetylase RimI-like enzyme